MPVNSKQIEWRDVVGFSNYEVSNNGEVRGKRFGIVRKPVDNGCGYYVISLWSGNTQKRKKVHRLVAEAFLERANEMLVVNHKNGNKHDNRVENLEWITQKENLRHAFETGLKPITEKQREAAKKNMKQNAKNFVRRVQSIDANGNVEEFASVKDAANSVGVTPAAIVKSCKGERKCKGKEWTYKDAFRQQSERSAI